MNKDQLTNGVNFVSVFKALYRMVENKDKAKEKTYELKPSEVIHQLYDDAFFIEQLAIEKDNIGLFLLYCDDEVKTKELLEEKSNFEIMDFLVKASEKFNKNN
jgi:hypothetical protein